MRRLLVAALGLGLLLLAADRVGAHVAAQVVAGRLRSSAGLAMDPSVTITGFPFLAQAVAGVYDDLELSATNVDRGGVRLQRVQVSLAGVHLPLADVASGSVRQVPVDGITARITVVYAAVQDRSRTLGLVLRPRGRGLAVTGRVSLLGQEVTATATATATVRGEDLLLTTGDVSVGGASTSALAGALDVRVPLGRLPYGLRLTGVTVTPAGLLVSARTGSTVLQPGRAGPAPALPLP